MCSAATCSGRPDNPIPAAGFITSISMVITGDYSRPRNVRKRALLPVISAVVVEDYDVIKVSGDYGYGIEATDGTLDAYRQVWNFCVSGFTANTNYFKIQGLNTDGSRNPAYTVLVDIDNLIDYMLNIFYTGNFDAPAHKIRIE